MSTVALRPEDVAEQADRIIEPDFIIDDTYPSLARQEEAVMMNGSGRHEKLWSVVLAGGEGKRLGPLTQQWLGRHRPKQYCTFTGTRSMLQHTLDRADRLTAPDRKVTVIARAHLQEARPQLEGRPGGVIVQPADRDTAAGIFLPLTYVRARDPRATVAIFPSDHFVYPEDRFLDSVRYAVQAAERLRDRLVLLGVQPTGAELDYGWIHLGRNLGWNGERVQEVAAFLEKPSLVEAHAALGAGALWNTFVMAARLETLWTLGWFCFPTIMQLLERLEDAIGTEDEDTVLDSIYQVMPVRNFSRDLVQHIPANVAVVQLNGAYWSDWGRPERIAESLKQIGKEPAFPLKYAMVG